jgi:hypothetical protein
VVSFCLRATNTVRHSVNIGKTFIYPNIIHYYCKYEECSEEPAFIKNALERNKHACACARARACIITAFENLVFILIQRATR